MALKHKVLAYTYGVARDGETGTGPRVPTPGYTQDGRDKGKGKGRGKGERSGTSPGPGEGFWIDKIGEWETAENRTGAYELYTIQPPLIGPCG